MMWALLDIRTGRANRMQFYLVFLVCVPALYFSPMIHDPLLCGVAIVVLFYFILLFLFRRYRDTQSGPKGKNAALAALGSLGLLVASLPIIAFSLVFSVVTKSRSIIGGAFFEACLKSIAEDILDPLVDLLFKSSTPCLTQYGLPPKGLNFLTMTYATYPRRLRQKASDMAKAFEAEEEKAAEEDSGGLEATMSRQARKAKRRKHFLFTDEYDVEDV